MSENNEKKTLSLGGTLSLKSKTGAGTPAASTPAAGKKGTVEVKRKRQITIGGAAAKDVSVVNQQSDDGLTQEERD